MDSSRRNLELKAIDPDPNRSLKICEGLEAEPKGVLRQRDIYFNVPQGRLKLRRQNDAVHQLIEAALTSVLGVLAVVSKARRLFLWEGVRIHLDQVDGLGNFIELEAVAASEGTDLGRFEMPLADLRRAFDIEDAHLLGESYSDLV